MVDTLGPVTQTDSHSPSPHRSRAKRKSDPFDHIPQLTTPERSPDGKDRDEHDHGGNETPDTLFNKVIMGPLVFTSFLISLLLVDRRDRAWRQKQYPASSMWARFANWIDPEPYQDPDNTTWQKDDDSSETKNPALEGNPGHKPERRTWFRQKKHRKMAKYEFEDAFALRRSVAAWLLGAGVLVVCGSAYAIKSMFGWRFW